MNHVTDDEKVLKLRISIALRFPLRDPCNNEASLCPGIIKYYTEKETQCKNYYLISLALIAAVFLFTIFLYVLPASSN